MWYTMGFIFLIPLFVNWMLSRKGEFKATDPWLVSEKDFFDIASDLQFNWPLRIGYSYIVIMVVCLVVFSVCKSLAFLWGTWLSCFTAVIALVTNAILPTERFSILLSGVTTEKHLLFRKDDKDWSFAQRKLGFELSRVFFLYRISALRDLLSGEKKEIILSSLDKKIQEIETAVADLDRDPLKEVNQAKMIFLSLALVCMVLSAALVTIHTLRNEVYSLPELIKTVVDLSNGIKSPLSHSSSITLTAVYVSSVILLAISGFPATRKMWGYIKQRHESSAEPLIEFLKWFRGEVQGYKRMVDLGLFDELVKYVGDEFSSYPDYQHYTKSIEKKMRLISKESV